MSLLEIGLYGLCVIIIAIGLLFIPLGMILNRVEKEEETSTGPFIQILGVVLVVVGIVFCCLGRKELTKIKESAGEIKRSIERWQK